MYRGKACTGFGTRQVRFESCLCLCGLGQIIAVILSFFICKMVLLASYFSVLVQGLEIKARAQCLAYNRHRRHGSYCLGPLGQCKMEKTNARSNQSWGTL